MGIGQVRRDEGKLVELVWRKRPSGAVPAVRPLAAWAAVRLSKLARLSPIFHRQRLRLPRSGKLKGPSGATRAKADLDRGTGTSMGQRNLSSAHANITFEL
jgi:hypothetical protein